MPFFHLPEPDGRVIAPPLAGFYMFWTMIILLQVISVELIIEFEDLCYLRSYVQFLNLCFPSVTLFKLCGSFQVLIPISLYVSIEIVKLGQIYFIQSDVDFYDEKMDSTIQCRALNITEDLGQIQYLFSDKTGTLTENKMVFRRCSVAGFDYCHEENGECWVYVKTNLNIGLFTFTWRFDNSSIEVLYLTLNI